MKKLLVGLLLLVFLFTACSNQSASNSEKKEESPKTESAAANNELKYAIWNTPNGVFFPLLQDVQQDGYVNSIVYNGLLTLNNKHELEPDLAKDYELSKDGLKLSFTLRDDVQWQDGEKFTAEDVKFTFESMAHKDYSGAYYSRVEAIKGAKEFHEGKKDTIEGIVVDGNKIIFEFEKPYAPALNMLGTSLIIPKHIWEKVDVKDWENQTELLNQPIGTGPFQVKEFKSGQYVKLNRNENYFKGAPKLEKFQFVVLNPDTAIAEILNGAVDIAEISSFKNEDIEKLKENDISIKSYPTPNIQYMGMNTKHELLQDVKVRKAIAYAIDRQAIVDQLLEGHGVIINTPMVPSLWSYPKDGLEEYKRDPEKAKELLKEAGYTIGSDNIATKDGKKLQLTLVVPTGNKTREQTAPIIQSQLKEIGIDVTLDPKEFPAVMDQVTVRREFDMYLMANTLDIDPDPKPNWYSTADWNFVGFENNKSDELIDKGIETTDQKGRAEIYHEWGKLLNDNLPWLPLYAPDIMNAHTNRLKGYEPNTFVDFYQVEKWELN